MECEKNREKPKETLQRAQAPQLLTAEESEGGKT
jgi:hypothetical protein